jgi:hypothetical protein
MEVQFTVQGQPSWIAELDSLSEHYVIKEFKSKHETSGKHTEIHWIERGYLGRISVGAHIVGRFWLIEPDSRARAPRRSHDRDTVPTV